MVLTVSFVLLCPKNLAECANGRLSTNRPSLDLSPFVLKGCEPDGELGTDPVSSSTRTVAWASSPDRARKGVMMAQDDLVVVGIDVAKNKVDACIRALCVRRTFPSTAQGRRKLVCWLRKHKASAAVMEASGGYEREWAKVLREKAVEVRIVDPKRVR